MTFEELQKRAEQGDMDAQFRIGRRYSIGKDYSTALYWLKRSAEQGDLRAFGYISGVFRRCSDANIRNDIEKFFGNFSDQGMLLARFYIGRCFEEKGKYEDALKCFSQLAEQGEENAQLRLAHIYEKGLDGIENDYDEALKWYIKASEKGSLDTNQKIGRFYEQGIGVTRDFSEALKWYQKGVTNKPTAITEQLGAQVFLAERFSAHEKYEDAFKWYKIASESSSDDFDLTSVYTSIGGFYEEGKGVRKSLSEAMKWYKKAAECGSYSEKFSFGKRLLEQGKYEEALYWLEKSEESSAGYKYASDYPIGELIKRCHDFLEAPAKLNEVLHSLIGLESVKREMLSIANLSKLQKLRKQYNLPKVPIRQHLIFVGNSGSGKSYVAPILAEAYRCAGILSKGQIVTAGRSELIANTPERTVSKAKAVIQSAIGGILLIDEASKILPTERLDALGQKAVNVLLEVMDSTDDLIVILADRPNQAESLVNLNPRLKAKFSKCIYFQDYTPDELLEIFKLQCKNAGLLLENGVPEIALAHFKNLYENRDRNFTNGYCVQDYFEQVLSRQANRLTAQLNVKKDDIATLTQQDVQNAATDARA